MVLVGFWLAAGAELITVLNAIVIIAMCLNGQVLIVVGILLIAIASFVAVVVVSALIAFVVVISGLTV